MDTLRAIVVGAELGSFARAAAQLGRSQSAVSMQLKKLERQAGRPLFRRSGRGLVPTEAGDALLAYARRIISLNDEAAVLMRSTAAAASVRIGLPQDFVEDIMHDALTRFTRLQPGIHVEVRAGRYYGLEEEVRAGRLDIALAFFEKGSNTHGIRMASLPMHWLGGENIVKPPAEEPIPLVLFDHPCFFRKNALQALDAMGRRWRLSLTTPSLPGVWAALRAGHGISVRTGHRVPMGIRDIGRELGLPKLPSVEVRMVAATELSPAATELREVLTNVFRKRVVGQPSRLIRK